LETVKKLGWTPDIIHCHGWMTGLVPLFVKRAFAEDPNFANSKIITSIYNERNKTSFDSLMGHKAVLDGVDIPDVDNIADPSLHNISKFAAEWSDAVIYGSENLDDDLKAHISKLDIPVLSEFDRENYVEDFDNFYDLVLEGAEVNAE